MVSHQEISHFCRMLLEVARQSRQRRMLVLSGAPQWCRNIATEISSVESHERCLWVSNHPPSAMRSIVPKQAASVLGGEEQFVIYDAHGGLDADAFGAVSGLVVGGGLFVLLTPDMNHWSRLCDAEAKRFMAEQDQAGDSHFIRRLCSMIQQSHGVYLLEEHGAIPLVESMPVYIENETLPSPYATQDQQRAVAAIRKTASSEVVKPTVLVSDRGRGKSASLGISAAMLLKEGVKKIVVTAPRMSAVDALFDHAKRLLPEAGCAKGKIKFNNHVLEFVAPDDLNLNFHEADLVMVDEAAAIPNQMLDKILDRYKRVVFATTVHGYEGSGRGFALRFNQVLNLKAPGWQSVRMHTPIRWAADDPVEKFVFDALMLNAAIAPEDALLSASLDTAVVECVNAAALLKDESLLSQVFGLLVFAHYRTRPNDLRQMLDSSSVDVYVLRCGDAVIGTALVAREGELAEEIADAVYKGNRRIRGNIIPQTLAAYIGMPNAATKRFVRIMRIAIHPLLQSKGYGSLLLSRVLDECAKQGCELAGVSYGATPQLIRFWRRLGFDLVRIGMTRDQASGVHSAVMLKVLDKAVEGMLFDATDKFKQRMPYLLETDLKDLDKTFIDELHVNMEKRSLPSLTDQEWQDLDAFAYHNLGMETVIAQLYWLAEKIRLNNTSVELSDHERELLLGKTLECKNWAELCNSASLSGKKEGLRMLRKIVAKFIEAQGLRS